MGCEESFITVTLIWHDYLILSLSIYVHKTFTETSLMAHLVVKRRKPKTAPHRPTDYQKRRNGSARQLTGCGALAPASSSSCRTTVTRLPYRHLAPGGAGAASKCKLPVCRACSSADKELFRPLIRNSKDFVYPFNCGSSSSCPLGISHEHSSAARD